MAFGSDFDQVLHAAKLLLSGADPYTAIGPGRAIEWYYPLYYPGPALLIGMPFTALPVVLARSLFFGISAGLAAMVFSRHENDPRMLFPLSGAFFFSALVVQWEPLLMAAALSPALGFLLAAKPTIGAAIFFAYPSGRAAIGMAVVVLASLALDPDWPLRWWEVVQSSPSVRGLAWHPLALLMLPALFRWRERDTRLLLALCVVPMTALPYSAMLLFLAVRSTSEAMVAIVGSWVAVGVLAAGKPYASDIERFEFMRGVLLAACWLPLSYLMLARRPAMLARPQRPTADCHKRDGGA